MLEVEAGIHEKVQVRPTVVEVEVVFFVAEAIEVEEAEEVTEAAEGTTFAEEESRSWIDPCNRYFYFDKDLQPRHFESYSLHCCCYCCWCC